MAATRYWRVTGIDVAGGGDLGLSEIALYVGGTRADGAATLSCSHAPIAGALADLKDGSTSAVCVFAASDVRSAGFYLQWDFGSAVDVSELRLGSSGTASQFISALSLVQGATPTGWVVVASVQGVVFPGANSLTTSAVGGLVPTAWNPSDKGSACTLSNGNLTGTAPADNGSVRSVFGASSGKWYWEVNTTSSTYSPGIGIALASASLASYPGGPSGTWAWFGNEGKKYTAGSSGSYGASGSLVGATIGVALDMDAGTVELFKNGVSMGVMYSGLTGTVYALCGGNAGIPSDFTANFGASAFPYSLPAGYSAGFGPSLMALPLTAAPLLRTVGRGGLIAASFPVGGHRVMASRAMTARNTDHGGNGRIYGTTKTKGTPNTPIKARVFLLHQRSKMPVRETWSDPITGYFEFAGMDISQKYLTLAEDADGNFRPVAASRLIPEVPV